jgi:hypothetical protein
MTVRIGFSFVSTKSLQLLEVQYAKNTVEKKTNLFAELVFDNNVLHNGTICEVMFSLNAARCLRLLIHFLKT